MHEIHISTPTDPPVSFVLQLHLPPGGTAQEYIIDCINNVTLTYACYRNLHLMHVKCTTIHHLKNVLTDRVAVNSCVADYQLGIQLLELKCNVHLLDSIANKCTYTLFDYDVCKTYFWAQLLCC